MALSSQQRQNKTCNNVGLDSPILRTAFSVLPDLVTVCISQLYLFLSFLSFSILITPIAYSACSKYVPRIYFNQVQGETWTWQWLLVRRIFRLSDLKRKEAQHGELSQAGGERNHGPKHLLGDNRWNRITLGLGGLNNFRYHSTAGTAPSFP